MRFDRVPSMSSGSRGTWGWIIGALVVVGVLAALLISASVGYNPFSRRGGGRARPARTREHHARRTPPAPLPELVVENESEREFVSFVTEVQRAIDDAAHRRASAARWNQASFGGDLRTRLPATYATLEPLGDFQIAATVLEVEAIARIADAAGYLRGKVLLLRGGKVRWLRVEVRRQSRLLLEETPGLSAAAPALAAFVERSVAALRSPACSLPMLGEHELADLAPAIARERDPAVTRACEVLQSFGGDATWAPRYDDFAVLVTGNGRWVLLRSSFVMEEGNLRIGLLRAAELREESLPPETAVEPAPASSAPAPGSGEPLPAHR